MKLVMITVAATLVAFNLAGCASTGNQTLKDETEQTITSKLVEGVTTKEQVQAIYGSPISVTFNDSAEEVWTYSLSNMRLGAENFIPYVGLLGGTAKGTEKRLVILFDKNNVIKRYSMTASDVEARTGIFNQ